MLPPVIKSDPASSAPASHTTLSCHSKCTSSLSISVSKSQYKEYVIVSGPYIIVSTSKSQYMACHSKSTIGIDRHIPSLQQVPVHWHINYFPSSLLTSFYTTLASQSASHSTPACHSEKKLQAMFYTYPI